VFADFVKIIAFVDIWRKLKMETEQTFDFDAKVAELKSKLSEIRSKHAYEIYLILKEIMFYRSKQFKVYGIRHLCNESNIGLTISQINFYMQFDYMSENSKKLIKEGKLSYGMFLSVLKRGCKLRKPEYQDKVINAMIEGTFNSTVVINSSAEDLLNYSEGSRNFNEDDLIRLRGIYAIETTRRFIKANSEVLKKYKHTMMGYAEDLVNEIKNL
jgi:hypothetical protein